MYRRTVDSDTYPTHAAKYDGDHNTFANCRKYGNSARNSRAVRPLKARTTAAGASVGPTRTNRCTWSGMTSLATISQPCSAAICSTSSPQRAATRPPRTRRRYFGHHTKCNPSEHTPPGVRRNRRSDIRRTLRNNTDKTNDHTLFTSPDPPDG